MKKFNHLLFVALLLSGMIANAQNFSVFKLTQMNVFSLQSGISGVIELLV